MSKIAKVFPDLVIGVCGFALDRALLWLRHRLVHWEREETD